MKVHIELTPEQYVFLNELLGDVVQLYEHQAAALSSLSGEGARDLAQSCFVSAGGTGKLIASQVCLIIIPTSNELAPKANESTFGLVGNERNFAPVDFFIPSNYQDNKGEENGHSFSSFMVFTSSYNKICR